MLDLVLTEVLTPLLARVVVARALLAVVVAARDVVTVLLALPTADEAVVDVYFAIACVFATAPVVI